MVREIQSKQEFDTLLAQEAGDKLVVVDFTATWCGPCRAIAPEFERLANKYSESCVLIKVDVDKCSDVARAAGISAMPTFQFYKRGQKMDGFRGAAATKLEQFIQKYSLADAEPNPTPEDEGSMTGCVLL